MSTTGAQLMVKSEEIRLAVLLGITGVRQDQIAMTNTNWNNKKKVNILPVTVILNIYTHHRFFSDRANSFSFIGCTRE